MERLALSLKGPRLSRIKCDSPHAGCVSLRITVQVTVFFSPNHLDELELRDKVVVVIDVLRASTTITYAMRAGAREIIPVPSVEAAMKIVGNLHSTDKSDRPATVLCGERGGKRIEGFKLGNSPFEYTEEAVRNKSLIQIGRAYV